MKITLPIPLPDFLTDADDEISITGHRITLYHVLSEYNRGLPADALAIRFPTLKLATIHKAIAFYLDNQPAVDEFLTAYSAALKKQEEEAPTGISLAEMQRRMEQIRRKAMNAAEVSY